MSTVLRSDGYAVLQLYRNGGSVKVAVSDCGKGIIETLRPGLQSDRRFTGLSDTDLVVEAFRTRLVMELDEDVLKSCADRDMI
jgi:hypothetical protein